MEEIGAFAIFARKCCETYRFPSISGIGKNFCVPIGDPDGAMGFYILHLNVRK